MPDRETTADELTEADYGKRITFTHTTVPVYAAAKHHVHTSTGVLTKILGPEDLHPHIVELDKRSAYAPVRVLTEGSQGYWSFDPRSRCVVHDA